MEPSYDMEPAGTEEQQPPQPRRRSGCLKGCFFAVLIVALGVATVLGYSAWYVYTGFRNDPRVQTIMDVAVNDARAQAVLGRHIHVVTIESHNFGATTGLGNTATYKMRLAGSMAEGELKVNLDLRNGQTKVKLMILTGPDGHSHVLVGKDPDNPFEAF